jgi:hypothetical protein
MKNQLVMTKSLLILLCISTLKLLSYTGNETTEDSFPFITGNTFRRFASDFILDNKVKFKPDAVQSGDIIFVRIDYLEDFFNNYHPKIRNPYILLTHHFYDESDESVPGKFAKYLEDSKLAYWFSHNIDVKHPKVKSLPIGLASPLFPFGDIKTFQKMIFEKNEGKFTRNKLLYANFSIHTNKVAREPVYTYLKTFKNITLLKCEQGSYVKPIHDYLEDLCEHKFIASPRGNGIDCFRTWEALLMGCIPIVQTSSIDAVYKSLPVVVINKWEEVTPEFLQSEYEKIKYGKYKWEKLYMPYWLNKLNKAKIKVKQNNNINNLR